jgi:transglutaminase-like putative cysteine protease
MTIRTGLLAAALAAAVTGCATDGTADAGGGDAASATPKAPPGRSFKARHAFAVTPPADAKVLRCWFALPQNDPAQTVSAFTVQSPHGYSVVADDQGNWFLFVEAKGPNLKPFEVVEEFKVARQEVKTAPDASKTRPLTDAEKAQMAPYLAGNTHVPVDEKWRKLATEITGGDQNPVSASRKLYDWTLKNVEYWVKYPDRMKASPVGSADYCMDNKTGNCTDFHSLWTALARSAGIPTRMVYGSFFKKDLDGKDEDQSYHCWIEFWAPGQGWIVHDVAVADLFVGDFALNEANASKVKLTTAAGYEKGDPAMVEYYFGNIDDRRVVWHRGRDLKLSNGASAPVNMLPKAWVEADGKPVKEKEGWTRKLTFSEAK